MASVNKVILVGNGYFSIFNLVFIFIWFIRGKIFNSTHPSIYTTKGFVFWKSLCQ